MTKIENSNVTKIYLKKKKKKNRTMEPRTIEPILLFIANEILEFNIFCLTFK